MSVALSFSQHSVSASAQSSRTAPAVAKGAMLLGGAVALTLAAALAIIPASSAPTPSTYSAATLVAGQGTSRATLLDSAEVVRARLLQISGVGAVRLRGLQPGGLNVLYAPARLARFGLTPADLRSVVPVEANLSAPGTLTVAQDAAQSGPQPIADTLVRAGGHVFRVGDVATVARTVLASPGATREEVGGLTVELVVTPAHGADSSLERRIGAGLAQAALPADIRLR